MSADCKCRVDGSEMEWIYMEADLDTIEAISQEAQARGLSIDEYFERSCERYEERKMTR